MAQLKQLLDKFTDRSKVVGAAIGQGMAKGANRILLIESRGFGINAYLVERRRDVVDLVQYFDNQIIENGPALADICQQMKDAKYTVPKQALLITGSATSALLNLPIEGDKKLADAQMLELVRWEMEPLFNKNIAHWSIGGILIACGYLTEPQRKQLLEDLGEQKERLAGRGGRAPTRFGELAVRAGFVTKAQLEECLAIHEKSQLLDPEIDCSWADQPISSEQQGGMWLCAAMNAHVRNDWLEAFGAQKIFLKGIYSQHDSAVMQLPVSKELQLLLVINVSLVTLIQVKNGAVTATVQHRCSNYALSGNDLSQLLGEHFSDQTTEIYYSGYHPSIKQFIEQLGQATACEMRCLDGVLDLDQQVQHRFSGDAAIMGAARHYFFKHSSALLSRIMGTAPPLPWYQKLQYQGVAFVVSIALIIGINEAVYSYTKLSVEQEIQQNIVEVEKIDAINDKLSSKSDKYKKLLTRKDLLKGELVVLQERKQGLNTVLLERQEFIRQLLPLISASFNDLIILKSLKEGKWYEFTLTGWAADQVVIDELLQRLTESLEPWNIQISDSTSREGTADFGLNGYSFTMILEPIDE